MIKSVDELRRGDQLKHLILTELKKEGLNLGYRHEGLCNKDMPEIEDIHSRGEELEVTVSHEDKKYKAQVLSSDGKVVRCAMSFLFGDGNVRYNYGLPVFQTLEAEDVKIYKKLAVEIWERNVHIDWMQKKGYITHNGTKDYLFLFQILYDTDLAVKTHNIRSDEGEKDDTPHHKFRDFNLFIRVMERNGIHPMADTLIESIYDQTTATTRIWYRERVKPFEERLAANRVQGYYFRKFRWTPEKIKFDNTFEKKVWQTWLDAHEEFRQYWQNKFGRAEEHWQPPSPIKKDGLKLKIA